MNRICEVGNFFRGWGSAITEWQPTARFFRNTSRTQLLINLGKDLQSNTPLAIDLEPCSAYQSCKRTWNRDTEGGT